MGTITTKVCSCLNGFKEYIPDAKESFVSLDLKSILEDALQEKMFTFNSHKQ